MQKNILQRLSWSAIFAGMLTGFAINFLLNLLMLALGISAFTTTPENTATLTLLGCLAFVFVSVITMFSTGWVAGRLSFPDFKSYIWGALIGLISWSLLLITTIIILTNMIQFTSFHSTLTSHPKVVAIKIVNDQPFATEVKESAPTNSPLGINVEKVDKIIVLNAAFTFILFLIGACSACLGGILGYKSKLHMANHP